MRPSNISSMRFSSRARIEFRARYLSEPEFRVRGQLTIDKLRDNVQLLLRRLARAVEVQEVSCPIPQFLNSHAQIAYRTTAVIFQRCKFPRARSVRSRA